MPQMAPTKLRELTRFDYGSALKSTDRASAGTFDVFGSNGVVGKHSEALITEPTIVIGRKGSVGAVTFAPSGGWPIDTTYFLAERKAHLDLRYLFYALSVSKLDRHTISTTIPGLNREKLYDTVIPLPFPDDPRRSLAEQKRIAAILDKADAIRRRRQEAARLADTLIPSVFYEMFGDPVGNPRRWPKSPLGSLCEIRRGSSPRPIEAFLNGPVPWIKIGDGTKGDLFYIESTEDTITKEGASRSVPVEPGALIVANSGVSLGFARIMKIAGCIHDGWLSLSELDPCLNKIFVLLLMNAYTDHLRRIAPSGTQPNLTTSIMKALEIPVPPRALQDDFERTTMRIQQRVEDTRVQVGKTDELFNSLVQRAFRGEL